MGVGVNDTADVASGADYLKTLSYVDPDRIGVFGLSYGGFLTLQAMTVDPTLWRAGIDVAGVVDWATYGAGYTTPRLGTPVQNPEHLQRLGADPAHGQAGAAAAGAARHQRPQRVVSPTRCGCSTC